MRNSSIWKRRGSTVKHSPCHRTYREITTKSIKKLTLTSIPGMPAPSKKDWPLAIHLTTKITVSAGAKVFNKFLKYFSKLSKCAQFCNVQFTTCNATNTQDYCISWCSNVTKKWCFEIKAEIGKNRNTLNLGFWTSWLN